MMRTLTVIAMLFIATALTILSAAFITLDFSMLNPFNWMAQFRLMLLAILFVVAILSLQVTSGR